MEVGLAPLNIIPNDLFGKPTGKNNIVDFEEQICEDLLHLILRVYNFVVTKQSGDFTTCSMTL